MFLSSLVQHGTTGIEQWQGYQAFYPSLTILDKYTSILLNWLQLNMFNFTPLHTRRIKDEFLLPLLLTKLSLTSVKLSVVKYSKFVLK